MQEKIKNFREEIEKLDNEKKIIEIKNIFIKNNIIPLQEQLKTSDDKKSLGLMINDLRKQIDSIVQEKILNLSSNQENETEEVLDVDVDSFKLGNSHLINSIINDISSFFKQLNFDFISGSEVVSDYYNFEALNIAKDHPARNMHDSLFINKNLLLRTHCTSNTSKVLEEENESDDIRLFSYGNVYRKDEDDATHSHQFTQIDFVWLKKDLSLANLKFIINSLINHIFNKSLKTRYRLSYFPFTEPSFEVDVECWKCKNQGCNICKKTGWIEILGAGMLNQNVIKISGNKKINTGIAAGIGVERIAMLKYGITDIRDLYNNDFYILNQFPKE